MVNSERFFAASRSTLFIIAEAGPKSVQLRSGVLRDYIDDYLHYEAATSPVRWERQSSMISGKLSASIIRQRLSQGK